MDTSLLRTVCFVAEERKLLHFLYIQPVNIDTLLIWQRAKKVVSDRPGLVDFAIRLVNSVINLPDGQVKFFEDSKLQKNCEINLLI